MVHYSENNKIRDMYLFILYFGPELFYIEFNIL